MIFLIFSTHFYIIYWNVKSSICKGLYTILSSLFHYKIDKYWSMSNFFNIYFLVNSMPYVWSNTEVTTFISFYQSNGIDWFKKVGTKVLHNKSTNEAEPRTVKVQFLFN